MISPSEGVHGKMDVVREVARILYIVLISSKMQTWGEGVKIPKILWTSYLEAPGGRAGHLAYIHSLTD